ncbi:hypothetical protein ACFFMN_32915 [Planobispora siamensis]|uniref:hypothetical protein n=1 Tax=Planobispora siamensis TaxID=936338 RepID=UPI001951BF50|nr:hypothetical protein [Planobispora siamensis]
MVDVYEEFSTLEAWSLECLQCRHVWEQEYTVRHLTDGHGHDVVVWLQAEIPVQPPWAGVNCPGCGVDRVNAFPRTGRPGRKAPSAAPADFERPPVEALYSPVPPRLPFISH